MTHSSMSLLDILFPPGNRWLLELSRRGGELPAGVRIVRFGGEDDVADLADAAKPPPPKKDARHRQRAR